MMDLDELPQLNGYVSVRKAAELLNLKEPTVRTHIRKRHLEAIKVGGGVGISLASIERFLRNRNPTGRLRSKSPKWHKYTSPNKLRATQISVKIKEGQEHRLLEKLDAIYKGQLHTLKGSIARYIFIDSNESASVIIWLVWKDTEMPDEIVHAEEMAAFRAELADVLDWDAAFYEDRDGLLYT